MEEQYEQVKQAVERLPLDQACIYTIYELRESATAVSAAIKLLKERKNSNEEQEELIGIAERCIHQNLVAISDLLVDRLLPRLRDLNPTR